jgi:hypothetical protein
VRTPPLLGLAAAIALSATAGAGSITIGTPLILGDVDTYENRHATGDLDLSPDQLQAISRWLDQHQSGWHGMITPVSSEPAELQLTLKHSDGGTTHMSIIARAGGGHYLRLTGPGTWAYRSFAKLFKSWAATRPMSDQELAALRSLVGTT